MLLKVVARCFKAMAVSSVQLGVDAIPTVCGQGCPTQRFIIHSCVQFRPFPLHSAQPNQVLDDVICPLHITYYMVLDINIRY